MQNVTPECCDSLIIQFFTKCLLKNDRRFVFIPDILFIPDIFVLSLYTQQGIFLSYSIELKWYFSYFRFSVEYSMRNYLISNARGKLWTKDKLKVT